VSKSVSIPELDDEIVGCAECFPLHILASATTVPTENPVGLATVELMLIVI